jgi:hypothetical protein
MSLLFFFSVALLLRRFDGVKIRPIQSPAQVFVQLFSIYFWGNKKAAYRTWCGKRQAKPDLPIFDVPSERYL